MFIFKKRVGYFLFFHLRNCQMETECSHITHNLLIHATRSAYPRKLNLYLFHFLYLFVFFCNQFEKCFLKSLDDSYTI